jgi:hypothetical protein
LYVDNIKRYSKEFSWTIKSINSFSWITWLHRISPVTRTNFLGFIEIYLKIPIHFEINPTQAPKWGWGRELEWGWGRELEWGWWSERGQDLEWGCAKILIELINPQQMNNSCGKINLKKINRPIPSRISTTFLKEISN